MTDKNNILLKLEKIIESRKGKSPEESYVAKLLAKGRKKIAQKVGEEGVELSIAAVENDEKEAIKESADLLFHMMVLWSDMGIKLEDVYKELMDREGISGIDEKKSRGDE